MKKIKRLCGGDILVLLLLLLLLLLLVDIDRLQTVLLRSMTVSSVPEIRHGVCHDLEKEDERWI